MAKKQDTQAVTSDSVIEALANIQSSTGEIVKTDGKTDVVLSLTCSGVTPGQISLIKMTLTQFDAIYKGWVKQWPIISPLKEQVAIAQRAETKAASEQAKATAKAAKEVEKDRLKAEAQKKRDEAKAAKEQAKAAAKAERDRLAAEAKAKKEAEAKAKAEAKVKADTAKAQEAANKLAEEQKKQAGGQPAPAPAPTTGKSAAKTGKTK